MLNTANPKQRRGTERNSISITVAKGRMVTVMTWTQLTKEDVSDALSKLL